MHRKLSAAFALALLGAASAAPVSAQTIRIATAGKTTVQLKEEIRAAAREVCWASYNSMPTPLEAYGACVSAQVKAATAQLRSGSAVAQITTDSLRR